MNHTGVRDSSLALQAKDLTVVLGGQKVLDIPDFHVRFNETLMIIGPNGSGKSTLLLSLALLLKPATGEISYRGVPVKSSREMLEQRRKLAVVLQEPLLLNSSVLGNVTLGLKLRKFDHHTVYSRARKWLERFGIAALEKRQARALSGGEARRVSLARAFALEPEILFLDEPFTALDSPTRQKLLEDFEGVLRETAVTTVMVTHDRNEALALGDRVAVIINGGVAQVGTTEEVFSTPSNEEIAGFVEAGNILHGVVEGNSEGLASVKVGQYEIDACCELMVGTRVILLIPYDDITLLKETPAERETSARNRFSGKIVKLFPTGSQMRVTVDCGFPLTALVTRRSAEEMGLAEGMQITASVKAVSIRVIGRH